MGKLKDTNVPSYNARMAGAVLSSQLTTCTATANQASVGNAVNLLKLVNGPVKMEERASSTNSTHTNIAAIVPCISPDDSVRLKCPMHHIHPCVPIQSARRSWGIKFVTNSAITMNVSGMEEIAPSTGSVLGRTAPPVFPVGTSSRMESVIKSVTTLGVSLTALSAQTTHRPPASKWILASFGVRMHLKHAVYFQVEAHDT